MAVIVVAPAAASAQSAELAAARAAYFEADLERAASEMERAVASGTLGRDDVVTLLELRALVQMGLGDRGASRRALALLAALDPSHRFAREVPPSLTRLFDEARADAPPLRACEIRIDRTDTGATITVDDGAPPPDLEPRTVVTCTAGTTETTLDGNGPFELRAAATEDVSCRAAVRIVGGAALSETSERSPATVATPEAVAQAAVEGSTAGGGVPPGGDDALAWGLGIGGGVLVVGTVLAIVLGVTLAEPYWVVDAPRVAN
jgi:hypothetical protein